MFFKNLLNNFLNAGLTPDEKGDFKVGASEIGRLHASSERMGISDFLRSGVTPDENGDFNIGASEAGRIQAYRQHRDMMDDLHKPMDFGRSSGMDDF